MGLRQSLRFEHNSREEIRSFFRKLAAVATLDDRNDFFVFSELPGAPPFTFDCELVASGINCERAGEYFPFLGLFIEALTGRFGRIEVEDQ